MSSGHAKQANAASLGERQVSIGGNFMGIMKCSIHGRSEFVEVCSHVATQIGAEEYLSGHRFDILGHLLICDACFNSLDLTSAWAWLVSPVHRLMLAIPNGQSMMQLTMA